MSNEAVLLEARLAGVTWRLDNLESRAPTRGPAGPPGPQGPAGKDGDDGEMPLHQWNGTLLRFELARGLWGEWTNLQGPPGETRIISGGGGSVFNPSIFALNTIGLVPAPTSADAGKFLRADATWTTPTASTRNSWFPSGW